MTSLYRAQGGATLGPPTVAGTPADEQLIGRQRLDQLRADVRTGRRPGPDQAGEPLSDARTGALRPAR